MENVIKKTREQETTGVTRACNVLRLILLIFGVLTLISAFVSDFNPSRIAVEINPNTSLFTSAFSRTKITQNLLNQINRGYLAGTTVTLLMLSSAVVIFGIVATLAGLVLSLGGKWMRRLGSWFPLSGSVAMLLGIGGIFWAYSIVVGGNTDKVEPHFPWGTIHFIALALTILELSVAIFILVRCKSERPAKGKKIKREFRLDEKYKLFLYVTPMLLLTLVFSYLPLYGWRYAFFNYKAGYELTLNVSAEYGAFVGFKWFTFLFENQAMRADLFRVLRNTLVMSGLGIATSFLPVIFAIFFSEIKSGPLRKFVQTFTTLPNFISWVLIYAFALSLFSTEGLVNTLFGGDKTYLDSSGPIVWLQMLLWGVWKGVGWSAIIYIAAITGIDQEQYEAASIDGAGRFKKMWHITVPSVIPTFSVMLLMAFAGILSNGLEQYLVFRTPNNAPNITVLDLFVYQLGVGNDDATSNIGLSTVISMAKSAISIGLLFAANGVSKLIRGESIL